MARTETKVLRENVTAGEPGYGLGLAGFIVSFFVSLAGLIMSAIALKQSKAIGKKNTFAYAGLILGIVFTALGILSTAVFIAIGVFFYNYCQENPDQCRDNNSMSGSHYYRGYDDVPMDRTY